MCRVSVPAVQNVVASFRVSPTDRDALSASSSTPSPPLRLRPFLREKRGRGKGRGSNFYVVAVGGHSYTVFPAGGHVICTGIRSVGAVEKAAEKFARAAGLSAATGPTEVINATYAGSVSCDGGGGSACHALFLFNDDPLADKSGVSISFRSQFFPGARVRWTGLGTANLFNNGKYVLVGVKGQDTAEALTARLCSIMRTHWRGSPTASGASRCREWTVV